MARKNSSSGQPGNAKQVNLVEEIRRQNRIKRRRKWAVIAVMVALVIGYLSGLFTLVYSTGRNWYESFRIDTAIQIGFPVQTGISALYQVEEFSGGFVALGAESCVVYSAGGNRLRSVQSAYTRPTIAVGTTRYLLYNRAGNELRVESRAETLYTKTFSNSILLASVSDNGSVAVVTESDRYLANLTMYSNTMQEQLSYSMTDSEGTPIRMAYAEDNKTLAVATISAKNGQMYAQVYLVSAEAGSLFLDDAFGATPMAIEWVSKTELLVLYDTHVALYDTQTQATLASYTYTNQTLADYSVYEGQTALLFTQGTQSSFVILDADFTVLAEETIDVAASITLGTDALYVVYEKEITSYSYLGEYLNEYQSEDKILALIQADSLFIFTSNSADVFTPVSLSGEV